MQTIATECVNILLLPAEMEPFFLKEVLKEAGYSVISSGLKQVDYVTSPTALRQRIVVTECHKALPPLLETLKEFASKGQLTIVFCKSCETQLQVHAFQEGVIVHVMDELSPSTARSIIDLDRCNFLSHHRLEDELVALQQAQTEHLYIEKAKYLLMEQKSMTEEMAYAFLRRSSMDCGQRLVDIARATINELQRRPILHLRQDQG